MEKDLLNHIIEIKSNLSEVSAKLDALTNQLIWHIEDNENEFEKTEASVVDLHAALNKVKGVWLAVSVASILLAAAATIQKLLQ